MSASAVRSQFRTWAGETSATTGFNFYDTINQEQNPTDNIWWTCEFVAEEFDGTFCAPDYIESGYIPVVVFAQPGIGDTAAIAAMEQIIPDLLGKTSVNLNLENYEPLQEDSQGSADRSYRVVVNLNYKYSA